jgi:hypothetical protein
MTLERVAMAAKWPRTKGLNWKTKRWLHVGCLKLADEALDRAREQETPVETRLKILKNGQNKLVNIAEAVYTKTD